MNLKNCISYLTILLVSILVSVNLIGQSQLSDSATISIYSVDRGSEVYTSFGHTGIRVSDPAQSLDYVFNYGIFSFNEPGFYTKFLAGKLLYRMGAETNGGFHKHYHREKRSVYEQKLDLTLQEKQAIYAFLVENYKPENRKYYYDFFFDNCSTRIADILDNNVAGLSWPQKPTKTITFREMLKESMEVKPWVFYGMDLIVGSIADKTTNIRDQLFLPMYLHDHLNNSFRGEKNIVLEDNLVADYVQEKTNQKAPFFNPILVFGILLIIEFIIFLLSFKLFDNSTIINFYDRICFIIVGIAGLIIAFMWFGTNHETTKNNWNLLWMNPFFLILGFLPYSRFNKIIKLILLIFISILVLLILNLFQIPQEIQLPNKLLIGVLTLKILRMLIAKEKNIAQ